MEQTIASEKQSSISVSKGAKGGYSWDLKLYYDAEKTTGTSIILQLKLLDEEMKNNFKSAE
jgi:hypothetical protein